MAFPDIGRAVTEDVDEGLDEDGAENDVGRRDRVDRSQLTARLLRADALDDRTTQRIAAKRRSVDFDEEPLEEGWVADKVGQEGTASR